MSRKLQATSCKLQPVRDGARTLVRHDQFSTSAARVRLAACGLRLTAYNLQLLLQETADA
jgi:hypothetical protein